MSARIVEVEAVPFVPPLRAELAGLDWFASRSTRQNILVRVRDDTGLEGLGESLAAPYASGETAFGAKHVIDEVVAPALVGLASLQLNQALERVSKALKGALAARNATDLALHDLAAKTMGVSVADLFGGPLRTELRASRHLHGRDVDRDVEEARRAAAEGYRALKVKVGASSPRVDIDRIGAIRAAVGDDVQISVDANGAWTAPEAILFVRGAREHGVALVEQPVPVGDLSGMAAVAAAGGPAVAVDEGASSAADLYNHARARAADAVMLKLLKAPGLRQARQWTAVALSGGLAIHLGGFSGETGISAAAALHLGATIAGPVGEVAIATHYLERDVLRAPVVPSDGRFRVPDGVGLGIDIDPDALEEFRVPSPT